MKTTERITLPLDTEVDAVDMPAMRADTITADGAVEVKQDEIDVYKSYADQIVEGQDLSFRTKKSRERFEREVKLSLMNNEELDDKVAALEEVIENARMPLHKKLGQLAGAKYMNMQAGLAEKVQNAGDKYHGRMERLASDKENDSRKTRVGKWLGRVATRTGLVAGGVVAAAAAVGASRFGVDVQANGFDAAVDNMSQIYGFGGNGSGGNGYTVHMGENSHLGAGRDGTLISANKGDVGMDFIPGQPDYSGNESNENMANRAADAVARNGEGSDVFLGHSQGTMAIAEYFEKNELQPDDKVVMLGGPYTPGQRLSDNDLFKIIKPMADTVDVRVDQELPGGENVMYIMTRNDLVGLSTNGKNNPGDILNRIVGTVAGDGHNYSSADIDGATAHKDIVNDDGSITRIILNSDYIATDGSPIRSGIGEGMAKNNIPVTPDQDEFFEDIRGGEDGTWDMQAVADSGSVLAEQALPGAGQVVHDTLSTPQAQVAADGYMEAQTQFLSDAATFVEETPVVQEAMGQAAEAWSDVAQSISPEMVDQGIQVAQDFANNIPAAPVVPPNLGAAISTFKIPGM